MRGVTTGRARNRPGAATTPAVASPAMLEALVRPAETLARARAPGHAGAGAASAGACHAPECDAVARAGAAVRPDPSENVTADIDVTPSAVSTLRSPSRRTQCLDTLPSSPAVSAHADFDIRP